MYVVVAVLSIAGDHVPLIPLLEVVGSALIVAPEQNGPTDVNVGVMFGVIVMVSEAVVAHCPAVGVNVYVVVAVLLIAGDHVPLIPLLDVVGSALIVAPEQNGPTDVNVGVMFGVIVMVSVAVVAH